MSTTPTHERRLTDPVDLTRPAGSRLNPGGTHLNPDAVGWSSTPLHRANLRGNWGRNKRWDYWAVLAGDLVVSATYADIDYLGLADVWWADLVTGEHGGVNVVSPLGRGLEMPEHPGTTPLRLRHKDLDLTIDDYSTNEKITYLPHKLSEEGSGAFGGEQPGDLCYYAPWGNLAFFHAGYRWSRGLIRLGRIEGGFEPLLVRGKFPLNVKRLS